MSTSNNASGSPNNSSNTFSLLIICTKVTFDGSTFNDLIFNIRMALWFKDKEYIIYKELNKIVESHATPEEVAEYKAHHKDATKVSCIVVATITHELQQSYGDLGLMRCARTWWRNTIKEHVKKVMR